MNQRTEPAVLLTELLSSPEGILALGTFIALLILIMWFVNYLPNQIENYRRGEEAEERAIQQILQALDGHWTVFRNINLPGRT